MSDAESTAPGEAPGDVEATEAKLALARSALAAEAIRRREIMDLVPMALLVTTADGTIREANAAATELLGDSWSHVHGKLLASYMVDDAAFASAAAAAVASRSTQLVALELERPQSDTVRVRGLVRWSRSRRGAENLLWAMWHPSSEIAPGPDVVQEALGRPAPPPTELLVNAAHEFQTPITAIISAIDVLQAGAKEIPADRDRFLGHVQWEAMRLARLVHALLVLERAKTGEPVVRTSVRLGPLLDEIAFSLAPAPGVVIRVECPADIAVWVDRNLLEQVIANLALNAAKYTDAGVIVLRGAIASGGQVTVQVRDTGAGIAGHETPPLFAPFERGGARSREGFGLGLAIVRQAVEALGGDVALEPADGGGTVATVTLVGRAVPA